MGGLLSLIGKVTGLSGRANGYGAAPFWDCCVASSPPQALRSGAAPSPTPSQRPPRSTSRRASCGLGGLRRRAGSAGSKFMPSPFTVEPSLTRSSPRIQLTDCSTSSPFHSRPRSGTCRGLHVKSRAESHLTIPSRRRRPPWTRLATLLLASLAPRSASSPRRVRRGSVALNDGSAERTPR